MSRYLKTLEGCDTPSSDAPAHSCPSHPLEEQLKPSILNFNTNQIYSSKQQVGQIFPLHYGDKKFVAIEKMFFSCLLVFFVVVNVSSAGKIILFVFIAYQKAFDLIDLACNSVN